MANIDAPMGLKSVEGPSRKVKMAVPAGYATALFIGDPVVRTGTNNAAVVKVGTEIHEIGTLPEINKCTAGDTNPITGVIVGIEADPDTLSQKHSPASTASVAIVETHPDHIFEIQADGAVGAASMGLNANVIFTHAGSTVSGLSGVELDTTSDAPAADASNQLVILSVSKEVGRNDTTAANTVVRVNINNHTFGPTGDNELGV